MEEIYDLLNVDFVVRFSEGHKGQNQRVLHLDLIYQDVLAPATDVGIEQERPGNRTEDEHVEKDEDDKEYLVPLALKEGDDLIVRIGIVTSSYVDDEDHLLQAFVVVSIFIIFDPFRHVNDYASYESESDDDKAIENDEDAKLFIGQG